MAVVVNLRNKTQAVERLNKVNLRSNYDAYQDETSQSHDENVASHEFLQPGSICTIAAAEEFIDTGSLKSLVNLKQ